MSVALALIARNRDIELHVGDDAAALQVARLALPVVEVTHSGVQRVPCANRHSLFAKSVQRKGNALFYALLASDDAADAIAVEQAVERLAAQHQRMPNVDAVAVRRLLQAAVEQAANSSVQRSQNAADDLANHLRDETVPLLLDRHEKLDTLLERTSSLSAHFPSAQRRVESDADVDGSAAAAAPRGVSIAVISIAILIVLVLAYLIASAACGGFELPNCIR